MTVIYEWDIETYDDEDIIDHDHADKLIKLGKPSDREKLVLVRDDWNEAKGDLDDRTWAYPKINESGKMELPETFESGQMIPKRLIKEIEKWWDSEN